MAYEKNMTDALKECKGITKNIMGIVTDKLSEEGIKYEIVNKYEISIPNQNKGYVASILHNINGINESQLKMILQISEVNGKIYIRQKFD